jgi:uncharacterized protein YigE (DUF2233 family)
MRRYSGVGLSLLALALAALACAAPDTPADTAVTESVPTMPVLPTPIFPEMPTSEPSATPLPPSPTPLPVPAEWTEIGLGLELREIDIPSSGTSGYAVATLVRFSLNRYEPRVLYDPNGPLTVSNWQELTGAPIVVNSGFYKTNFQPDGLLISDGQPFGISYDRNGTPLIGFEGSFEVTGESAQITTLLAERYDPSKQIDQAVQSYPVLVRNGLASSFNLPDRAAPRAAVAIDREGRVTLVNISQGAITLTRLRDWLLNDSGIEPVAALNLCGGPAAGMVVQSGGWAVNLDSTSQVPSVIAIFERQ